MKPYKEKNTKSFNNKSSNTKSSTNKSFNTKSSTSNTSNAKSTTSKSFNAKSNTSKSFNTKSSTSNTSNTKSFNNKSSNTKSSTNKSFNTKSSNNKSFNTKSSTSKFFNTKSSNNKSFNAKSNTSKSFNTKSTTSNHYNTKSINNNSFKKEFNPKNEGIRLNRYIANCGYCSRREADELILTGSVSVNGKIITQLGTRIIEADKVMIGDVTIKPEKKIYILMNKPKDYITTSKDPQNRKTVMNLLGDLKFRVYPVGRLDRNTTGILLFTNDGDLARKLTHPSSNILKIYEVKLDKNLKINDLQKIIDGIYIDGHKIFVDEISYVESKPHNYVGISIHSGQYHIVKRLFESLGYKVLMLDRTMFGPLTKKNVPRGTWRYLTDSEVRLLMNL